MVALDLYLAYLRAAFHACYYCAVVTDHVEELQRKCVKHVRKPLSKSLLQEVKAAEAQKLEKDVKTEGEDEKEGDKEKEAKDKEKEKEKEKEAPSKDGKTENRDWKRNGACECDLSLAIHKPSFPDERWLEWLDSKLALLINRDGVDPRDYNGKSYDMCVFSMSHSHSLADILFHSELSKACEPYIKQEDEGKFRCKTCQKLFKATSFVEKHVANKHPELVKHLADVSPTFCRLLKS